MIKQFSIEEYLEGGYKVVTREGKEVEILKTDARGEQPIVGILKEYDCDSALNWSADGLFHKTGEECLLDLMIECPDMKKRVFFLTHYAERSSTALNTDEDGWSYRAISHTKEDDSVRFEKYLRKLPNVVFIKTEKVEVEC